MLKSKSAFLMAFLCYPFLLSAQIKVVLKVYIPQKTSDQLYLAGSFNNWNPKDEKTSFKQVDSVNYLLQLDAVPGTYEYKITRGSWDKGEVQANGKAISNRFIDLKGDSTISFAVAGWADQFPALAAQHTYSPNVHLLDTAFQMPQLGKKRRVWIYLPPGYESSKKRYPVLYMHDGQNLFDVKTSGYGEWGVDEVLDSLNKTGARQIIVVGIDHGGDDRLKEYNPYDSKFGKGQGKVYMEFLVKTLKPYVDHKFRTLSDVRNTSIAGSSMGGLISMYALAKYPEVFGNAGVFSPAFWIAPDLYKDVALLLPHFTSGKVYFVAGALEGEGMLTDMEKMYRLLSPGGHHKNIRLVERPDGKHSEWFWHREFPAFYQFIFKPE